MNESNDTLERIKRALAADGRITEGQGRWLLQQLAEATQEATRQEQEKLDYANLQEETQRELNDCREALAECGIAAQVEGYEALLVALDECQSRAERAEAALAERGGQLKRMRALLAAVRQEITTLQGLTMMGGIGTTYKTLQLIDAALAAVPNSTRYQAERAVVEAAKLYVASPAGSSECESAYIALEAAVDALERQGQA